MIYRELGRTGLKVSQLSFGAMRLPMTGEGDKKHVDRDLAIPMLHRAFDAGVNYVDSAVFYCSHDSQQTVGEAIKGRRDEIIVSTKNHWYGDEAGWWHHLDYSLKSLDVDYIDVYNHHGINWTKWTESVEPLLSKLMVRARDQGLIRHICCSFHDNNENLMSLVDTGYPESITLQYNMLDRQLEEGIAYAHDKGIGVVVMGAAAGGKLGAASEVFESLIPGIGRVPELALRFVLSNPNVSCVISGMSDMRQVEENLASSADATELSAGDRAAIAEHVERLGEMTRTYCTACGYCMPCNAGHVNIPEVFAAYSQGRVYGFWDHAQEAYEKIATGEDDTRNGTAEACTQCGECEGLCPQDLPIRERMQEIAAAMHTGGEYVEKGP